MGTASGSSSSSPAPPACAVRPGRGPASGTGDRASPPGRRSGRCGPPTAGRSCCSGRRASGTARAALSRAIGPASGSPAAIRGIASRWARTSAGSQSGASARRTAASSSTRAARNRRGREWSTIPALNRSPRSTRGTTRTMAYSNGLRRVAGTLGLLDERARGLERGPAGSRRRPRRCASAPSPSQASGIAADDPIAAAPASTRGASRSSASTIEPAYGSSTWSAICSNGRRACSAGSRQVWWTYSAAPWSMSHSRRCQTSRLTFCAVRSTFVTSASNQTMSAARSGPGARPRRAARRRVERQRPGQEVETEVEAGAAHEQVLDLGVRLGPCRAPDRARRGRSPGTGRPSARPSSPRDQLGDQRLGPLAGAVELDDVQPVVVGLDEAGQRAALAERRDVAGRGHGPERQAAWLGGGRHRAERSRATSRPIRSAC